MKSNKVIVILGPTSSGKTSFAVKLAHRFSGEIVSADSRQVYRGMDIGTGKDLSEYGFEDEKGNEVNIPYHLIDVVGPNEKFDIVKWNKLAKLAIDDILKRGKLPMVVGGTGLYIQSLVDDYNFSEVKPDKEYRKKLEEKSEKELRGILEKIKPEIIEDLDNNDFANKRRLIRYIEILKENKDFSIKNSLKNDNKYNFLLLGLTLPREEINKKIHDRLLYRIEREGLIDEVKKLHEMDGVSWERFESLGLEYKHTSWYLNGKIDYDEMIEKTFIAIRQFAKRQMTWFKRWEKQGADINWAKDLKEADKLIKNF